jgi:uncharacterized protein (TIGR02231 family)
VRKRWLISTLCKKNGEINMLRAAIAIACIIAATPSTAAEIKGTSHVVAVTVFPSGAEVTRTARVRIEAGEHVVLVTDLPAQAVSGSIRVEGKSSGRLEIGSVDTRRVGVPRTDPVAAASDRRNIEVEIEKLKDERAGAMAQSQAAETQKLLIGKLVELPAHLPSGGAAAPQMPDWNQLFALIGERTADAQKVILDAQVKLREIDRKILDLEKRLVALAPVQEERTEAKIYVSAGAALDAELSIRYQVSGASWTPFYDARLTTGARNAAPSLLLVRRAAIQQRSGEDWVDVALALSTTRPGSGTAAPELFPMLVDFQPDQPAPRPVASAPAVRSLRSRAEHAAVEEADGRAKVAAASGEVQDAVEKLAGVETAPFQAIFTVPGKVTVLATGETKRVGLDEAQIEPALSVRTGPRVDPRAFLYVKMALPKTAAYLPGAVSLFRDGTFVGTGRLPLLAGGEEHELGFGVDDAVRVRHALIEEKRGEAGLITSSKTDQRSYRVTVKNTHERAIALTILDQIPVSQNQDIKVELIGKTAPSRRDPDEKRGVLAWDAKLEPGEERQVEFGYRVTWPAGKNVKYGR